MKFFYALLVLLQLLLALFRRDKNRVAYLMYLWSNQVVSSKPSGSSNNLSRPNSNYKETKSEMTNSEYSLLTER